MWVKVKFILSLLVIAICYPIAILIFMTLPTAASEGIGMFLAVLATGLLTLAFVFYQLYSFAKPDSPTNFLGKRGVKIAYSAICVIAIIQCAQVIKMERLFVLLVIIMHLIIISALYFLFLTPRSLKGKINRQ